MATPLQETKWRTKFNGMTMPEIADHITGIEDRIETVEANIEAGIRGNGNLPDLRRELHIAKRVQLAKATKEARGTGR